MRESRDGGGGGGDGGGAKEGRWEVAMGDAERYARVDEMEGGGPKKRGRGVAGKLGDGRACSGRREGCTAGRKVEERPTPGRWVLRQIMPD